MDDRCAQCRRYLDRQWDDELVSDSENAALASHVASCEACRAYRAQMEQILSEAESFRDLRYSRDIVVAPLQLSPARAWGPWWGFALGLSTAAAVFSSGLLILRSPDRAPTTSTLQSTQTATLVRLVVPVDGAQSVAVMGDFTGWKEPIALQPAANGLWTGELRLPAGRYRYMIVVDGERMLPDPGARQLVDDGFGGKSSVLDVGSI